jgi:hypothetical protein
MIEEATVDAYGESEQVGGFHTMIDEHFAMPFETTLLGLPVTVRGVDTTERDEIVAICSRGRLRQAIPILDLVLPLSPPAGAEWIEAYQLLQLPGAGTSPGQLDCAAACREELPVLRGSAS